LTPNSYGYILYSLLTVTVGRTVKLQEKLIIKNMPRLDGTGPRGDGPMSGRGMGPCSGRPGMGCFGRGWGLGYGQQFRSPKNQLQVLEEEKQVLMDELEAINEEIESLKKSM
jgi:hypothetical protein